MSPIMRWMSFEFSPLEDQLSWLEVVALWSIGELGVAWSWKWPKKPKHGIDLRRRPKTITAAASITKLKMLWRLQDELLILPQRPMVGRFVFFLRLQQWRWQKKSAALCALFGWRLCLEHFCLQVETRRRRKGLKVVKKSSRDRCE